MNETKKRILDTAECLFGEYGYAATSLRHIISEARVNLAAVHYHFGSKQELLDQVILRKAGPLNAQRLALLDQFEMEASPKSASVEKVLEAFIAPAVLMDKSPEFIKLMGRVHSEGLMPEIAQRRFQPMIDRFLGALRRALPDISMEDLAWKAHFALGAIAVTLLASPQTYPEAANESSSRIVQRLVAFLSGGFSMPAVLEKEVEANR
jgi:AcrR family transcriptional regulator